MNDAELLELLRTVARRTGEVLGELTDRRPTTGVAGQYALDVAVDGVVVPMLLDAGLGVLSEESGLHEAGRDVVVVIDPVDGSTNASRHIPWCASSLCAVDAEGARVALVANLASGESFDAIRGAGARCDGVDLTPSTTEALGDALIVFNGLPPRKWGWSQYRTFGAAALELCFVAAGRVDGYVDLSGNLGPWDYLGALLVCREAGVEVVDAAGRPLEVLEHGARRSPVAAGTPALLAALREHRGADAVVS